MTLDQVPSKTTTEQDQQKEAHIMRAWVADQTSHAGLSFRELPDPPQREDEALIQVQAFAPNPGDLAALATVEPGSVPGWDGAGTVLRNATNGNGPTRSSP